MTTRKTILGLSLVVILSGASAAYAHSGKVSAAGVLPQRRLWNSEHEFRQRRIAARKL
jgi:hypothetical protein